MIVWKVTEPRDIGDTIRKGDFIALFLNGDEAQKYAVSHKVTLDVYKIELEEAFEELLDYEEEYL